MIRRPPRSTRTDTLFPYTTLFRSSLREALEADTIILAIPFREHREVAKILPNWAGKTIIDATNVFGVPSEELDGLPSSAFVAKAFTGAKLVKGFNHLIEAPPASDPIAQDGHRSPENARVGKGVVRSVGSG